MRRVLFLVAVLCLAVATAKAQDPVKVAPKNFKVVFENDQVRVLRSTVGPHEKLAMHEHPASVVVSLTDGNGRSTLADNKTRDSRTKAGDGRWAAAEKHAYENLSDKAGEAILVELKAKAAPAKPAAKKSK